MSVDPAVLPALPPFFRVITVGVPLALVLGGALWFAQALPRVRRSRAASGVVVDVAETAMPQGRPIWRLTVEYQDDAGVPRRGVWSGESTMDLTIYRVGMPVPVRYDPRRPEWVYLPGGGRPHPLLVPGGLVLVGLVGFFGFQQLG